MLMNGIMSEINFRFFELCTHAAASPGKQCVTVTSTPAKPAKSARSTRRDCEHAAPSFLKCRLEMPVSGPS